ncbi:kinesin-like protein KIF26A [Xenentodon cancila]
MVGIVQVILASWKKVSWSSSPNERKYPGLPHQMDMKESVLVNLTKSTEVSWSSSPNETGRKCPSLPQQMEGSGLVFRASWRKVSWSSSPNGRKCSGLPRQLEVVEGDTPLPLDTCRRKCFRSAVEGSDEEARRSCSYRPNPEGSLSSRELSRLGNMEVEETAELQRLCQRCHIMTSQLNRQAAALADTAALKDPAYASFLLDKLQRLQWPRRGRPAASDARCEVCGVAFQQLRRLALQRALGIGSKMSQPATPSAPTTSTCGTLASESEWESKELPVKQQRSMYNVQQQGGGTLSGWGGIHSTYLGGGGTEGLAKVTPLNTQNYLEGVWRVSCCPPELHHATALAPDASHVTITGPTQVPVKPAAHSIGTQTSQPPSAAVAFFIRTAQKFSLSRRKKSQQGPCYPPTVVPGQLVYTGGFSGALQLSPPAVPPCLLRAGSKMDTPGMGKVRVMVRICSVHSSKSSESMSFLKVDSRKKQLTLCESAVGRLPSIPQRRSSASSTKTFTFDAVFTQDTSQAEVCSATVAEVIQSVVNGADGCIFCFGHANLGKTYTMIGRECSTQSLGVAPTAISWLFKVIEERREKSGTCFSVGVSAVEISGQEEVLTDLLAELSSSAGNQPESRGPAVSLQQDPVCGSQLQNQTELQATSAEQAAFFLDTALAERRSNQMASSQEVCRNSHFLLTLHLYQERLDKSNKAAVSGQSRLHILDLGSCETDISRTREGARFQCLSLSALGNVILALAIGAKHVPYRDSKLTMLLSESLGNINCRTTMIAHISDSAANFMETLTTVQLASRVHRTRKKKTNVPKPGYLQLTEPNGCIVDSKLTMLLSESLGNINCRTTMIAHISDSAANFMETLTTVQLASRVHRTRKKKTNIASSSSGGESSCEEGPSHRPPHLKPFYSQTMALDPDRPLVLSSDPDYSSSSEQSCDTIIYVGPAGSTISDRELSDSEGPPSFVPIIPSLNKKRVKDASDGNHLKCNTFAELQERLDCIDGSESPAIIRVTQAETDLSKPTEEAPTPKSNQDSSHGLSESTPKPTTKCDQRETQLPSAGHVMNSSKRISSDEGKLSAPPVPSCLVESRGTFSQDFKPVVREKDFLRGGALKLSASLSPSRTPSAASEPGKTQSRVPSVGMSCKGQPLGSPSQIHRYSIGRCLELDFLRTTVTLQQPVELNGEDEVVFTVIEELPCGFVSDNGRPANFLNFGADLSLQASHPVSIISSINDEYDAYMTQSEAEDPGIHMSGPGPDDWKVQSSACSAKPEGSHLMKTSFLRYKNMAAERASTLTSPSIIQHHRLNSSLNDSGVCFSELDSDPATPNTSPFTKCDPSLYLASHKLSHKPRALNTPDSSNSSLPRKTKFSSSASVGYSRQESSNQDFLTSSTLFMTASKLEQVRGSTSSQSPGSGRLKVQMISTGRTRSLATSSKPPDIPVRRNTGLPPTGKSPAWSGTETKVGKGTIMGTKQAINKAANNRVSQLAAGSSRKQLSQGSGVTRSEEIDSELLLPSPYSKITAPRRPQRYSSGHGSDNSSILSGELPPAMGHTALFYHSGGSSGYESMIRDSETTGSTSSTHDSMSESSASSSTRGRVSKSPKKKGNSGFLRRRLIPAPLPDTSSLGRRVGGQWVDRPPLGGALKEPFEIKVYEIDNVGHLQRRKEVAAGSEGLLYINGRLRMLERRQQQIRDLKSKHERLKVELEEAKNRLMLHPTKWSSEFDVDQDLEQESQEYLESLAQVTAELECCINLCKSRIMMETCFDVAMTTIGGHQKMEA